MTVDLEIRLLGGLQILHAQTPLTDFMSNKVRALLAYLAVTRRPHQRDALAALFWGEMSDADAKNNLRQALSNLRKHIDPFLLVTRDSVEVNPVAPLRVDCVDFLAALQSAATDVDAVAHLQRAAALYQGDFLAGFSVRDAPDFEEWVLLQRTHLRELALQALHTLTNHHLHRGDYAAAIESAGQLLTLDNWREEAHQQLMLALARSGQRAAAIQQYEACRRLLKTELDVEPSAELRALATRIRDALREDRPALPTPVTPLVGRSHELARVLRRLADPGCRLVTLTGPGGMGKTRLALEIAAAIQPRFLNGVCFTSLTAVDAAQADGALLALVDALRLPLSGGRALLPQVIDHLHPREMLVVLDAAEHLVDQLGWIDDALRQAPDLKFLVTSQERLNLDGEWVVGVESLPLSTAPDGDWPDGGAEHLFVAEAQRAHADFNMADDNRRHISRICRLVDGLPLGIVLAAAWTHVLSCAEIAAEIAANLDFLSSSRRDMPPRQRSLRAVFDYAWRLLPAAEQSAFAALSVFPSSFSREAAQEIVAVKTPLLAALVARSLLRRQEEGRFELHQLLRQYAAQQLEADRHAELADRHAAYFARWLHRQEAHIYTPQCTAIFVEMARDHDNLRTYWQWSLSRGQWDLLAQGLITFRLFYSDQGRYTEGISWMEQTAAVLAPVAEPAAEDDPVRRLWGRVLARWGAFCLWGGETAQAGDLLARARAIAQAVDDHAELGFTLLNLGNFHVLAGELAEADAIFNEALRNYRAADKSWGVADALSALGALANTTGDLARARGYLEESVALGRRIGDERGLRSSLTNLGNVFYLSGDPVQARAHYLDALPLCQRAGDRSAEAILFCNLGSLAYEQGDLSEAESMFQQGIAIFDQLRTIHHMLHAMTSLVEVHIAQGRYELASSELIWASQTAMSEQIHYIKPMILYEAGLLYRACHRYENAFKFFHWVLAHPTGLAEHKEKIEQWLPALEVEADAAAIAQLHTEIQALSVEEMLARLEADLRDFR
ncbi:MAG: tetratricopeptide repeat protein [Caldilineaceae bacterium]|nr:tetratricopeptide repeat protein [Caldilineaceae bacterium]